MKKEDLDGEMLLSCVYCGCENNLFCPQCKEEAINAYNFEFSAIFICEKCNFFIKAIK